MITINLINPVKIWIDIRPLSQNGVYRRSANRRMFMTDEGKAFKAQIGWDAKRAMMLAQRDILKKDLIVVLKLHMPDRRTDPANVEKLLFDALQGIVFENDRQIRNHYCEAVISKDYPGIELQIAELC